MNTNAAFLAEFMKSVDMRFFTPSLYKYLEDFLEIEKVRKFNSQYVLNTFIPPFPSRAFDRFMMTFFTMGETTPIQSVDLAVTNACMFNCWHCYNEGRTIADLPTDSMKEMVVRLQDQGAIVINFTGGEPCLRHDIAEICSALREDSCGILATTGYGFTDDIAERLKDTGVYSISVSLDSADENEHDRKRGQEGAFKIALKGIETAKKWGFYTYTCAVPSKKLLKKENFQKLFNLNKNLGVNELQLIEPAPAGKIVSSSLAFGEEEFARVLSYMQEYNSRDDDVAISSFAHMESPEFFGCGAGFSHIYVDGTGEVSPCNMIPISYGNASKDDLGEIIGKMQNAFKQPCQFCWAHELQDFFSEHAKGLKPVEADSIPVVPVPPVMELPGFFQILVNAENEIAGHDEIITGYDGASSTYEDYWLSLVSPTIDELFEQLEVKPGSRAIDCGCGTGYSTAILAERAGKAGFVTAIDLSAGMIEKAKDRISGLNLANVIFSVGDVLTALKKLPNSYYDTAVLTWLIGYVGCWEVFPLLRHNLKPGGTVGFVAHLDRSPLVPIEIFEELVREEPGIMMKTVKLKFPADAEEIERDLQESGFKVSWLKQGSFDFVCKEGKEVYDHVMNSGAGTTFYYSLKPEVRERVAKEFIRRVDDRFKKSSKITIVHDYVVGIGTNTGDKI